MNIFEVQWFELPVAQLALLVVCNFHTRGHFRGAFPDWAWVVVDAVDRFAVRVAEWVVERLLLFEEVGSHPFA